MLFLIFLTCTYFIASIPFGLLISKFFSSKDIRQHGSKNIGATNVTRILGKKLGFITLFLDGSKGAIMILAAQKLFSDLENINQILALVALISVLGHIFPIYLKFKGGKGVATSIAVILALNPICGLVAIITWISIFFVSKISALASLASILLVNIFAIFYVKSPEQILLYLAILILIFVRHIDNIMRLKDSKENEIK